MKKSLKHIALLLAVLLPTFAAAYDLLTDGVYQDGSALYITNGVTSIAGLNVNPTEIYSYATTPPTCDDNTFVGYEAAVHVPTSAMVAYFMAPYWYYFADITADAVEPLAVTVSESALEIEVGHQVILDASVAPTNAFPTKVFWSSSDVTIATVVDGTVLAMAPGECDIIASCLDKQAVCHVVVNPITVHITLDRHAASVLPNHLITLTATCTPTSTNLVATSSDNTIAMPRIVNGTIQVLGLKEGTATITVGSMDGTAVADTCLITVYTEVGDVNCDGFVNVADVSALIQYLLTQDESPISIINADVSRDGNVNVKDVSTLINYLLTGLWPWQEDQTFTVNGVSFTMKYVEGGTFTMGATAEQGSDAYSDEYPTHQVTLSDYYIGETEVTQALWQAVMGNNPSYFSGNLNRPVDHVFWYDCQEFILKLNNLTGKQFRLPTEAEWEFAARGGNKSKGYKYAGSNTISDVAWYCDNSYAVGSSSPDYGTHTVATKAPNELGIYDMSGNVREWCQDWYGSYSYDAQSNPLGPILNSYSNRVYRGGGYGDNAEHCRISKRGSMSDGTTSADWGMRLVLDNNSSKFHLSETVVELMLGESKNVSILNGDGNYTIEGGMDCVSSMLNGNLLTVTGQVDGATTVFVTNNDTGAKSFLNVIVKDREVFSVNGVSFTMVAVEGGTFTMGANEDDTVAYDNEKPAHDVTLPSFSIGQTEVTQELWVAVMGSNPSWGQSSLTLHNPVDGVGWWGCLSFISKLNALTGQNFRLPTEAEWEYAARGGNKSRGYKYAGSDDINNVAYWGSSYSVGITTPNELGIYDMSGNVWEWCQDWYDMNYYSVSPSFNPQGPLTGEYRVARGGSFGSSYTDCRVSNRQGANPINSYGYGFRLAL